MRSLVLAAFLVCAACTTTTETSGQSPATSFVTTSPVSPVPSTTAAVITRSPATLPVFPEEAAVVAALDAAGIRLTLIGSSKFETLLGDRQRTRVFIEAPGAAGAGADVLFLERPIDNVRVCVSKAASGLNRYDLFIGDRLVDSGEGTQTVYYSVSGRYFIQAFGKRFSDALMAGLGTVTPPC